MSPQDENPTLVSTRGEAGGAAAARDAGRDGRSSSRPARAGGLATTDERGPQAFSQPASVLSEKDRAAVTRRQLLLRTAWVPAPSADGQRDGLGPLFNAAYCEICHLRDGRGRPPVLPDEPMESMILRLGLPGPLVAGRSPPEPTYGSQLQPLAVAPLPGEGQPRVSYREQIGHYGDGSAYSLRQPSYSVKEPAYGALHPATRFSGRVAPSLIGVGLLEAVPTSMLEALADPDDSNGDGISGESNRVPVAGTSETLVGRFGWKAAQPSVRQQTAAAFAGDIGITTSLFSRGNCTAAQQGCLEAGSGGDPELSDERLDEVVFYVRTLAVPARRHVDDPLVTRGEQLFMRARCGACHVPTLRTGRFEGVVALSEQEIHPYSDLLLHDMGEALADGISEYRADGRQWRTPPLWGVGLLSTVNNHQFLLHDGRARGFAEAILWHGGEAAESREAFRQMSADERHAVVRFLESL